MNTEMSETRIWVRSRAWRQKLADPDATAARAVAAALRNQGVGETGELCVILADDRLSRRLNREFRGQDAPTNVLAFPVPKTPQGPSYLGDVVISLSAVTREAEAARVPIEHHLSHLVVHGTLHLLGFDHERSDDAERMERLEADILGSLGIGDPYQDDHGGTRHG